MTHRIWRESKLQPSRARSGNLISCCLISLHFLCDILQTFTVLFRLEPEAVELADDKRYFITQPGSSVATSLIEGEAKEKKVGILHIRDF